MGWRNSRYVTHTEISQLYQPTCCCNVRGMCYVQLLVNNCNKSHYWWQVQCSIMTTIVSKHQIATFNRCNKQGPTISQTVSLWCTWWTSSSATSMWLLRAAKCRAVYPSSFFSSTSHGLGSFDSKILTALHTTSSDKLSTVGSRAFIFAASYIWNRLPTPVSSSESQLTKNLLTDSLTD